MVHLHSLTTFAGTALYLVGLALAQAGGNGLTLKVLTGSAHNACSPQEVTTLKSHLKESIDLAEAGSKALNVRGVEFSDAFTSFLGNADPKQMDAQHYAPIASLRSADLQSVTSDAGHTGAHAMAPAGETLFTCLVAKDVRCTEADGKASGLIALATRRDEIIELCPIFFQKVTIFSHYTKKDHPMEPMSLADAKAPYLAGEDNNGKVLPGRTLFHEFQHLWSAVGKHWVDDLYIRLDAPQVVVPRPTKPDSGVIGVYHLEHCMGIPAHLKCINAQNLAFFALDVWADPDRARPKPFSSSSSKKTPKRFEVIHQRGAEKAAAAKPGAKDTPEPTGGAPADKATTGTEKPQEKAVSKYKRPKNGFTYAPPISDFEA